jgi:hypothetical protein
LSMVCSSTLADTSCSTMVTTMTMAYNTRKQRPHFCAHSTKHTYTQSSLYTARARTGSRAPRWWGTKQQ